ncbi:SDR family oxidoreductase [Nocardioides marmoribigeumensis]|uniref:Short-subunit dehydrogenase n=1 Tax=Nocardioides marmoribigeumensis TaxID=433649 RepID=A0ABU2BQU1_9ACTN|nr:SDR family oxidoreductase [Nocardioides marmoribigeumensis]MDR7360997.1 short-subunit dehydrogenase [Nocardioides marmoribigeumensis]
MARSRQGLRGLRVAVTGGAQGIGRSIAERLVAEGALVVIGDVQKDLADRTAEALGCTALALDVTDGVEFEGFLDQAGAALGGLDVLVNNAGIMPIGPFLEEDDRTTTRCVEIDLLGVLTGTKLAGRRFREQGHGHVVNVASALGTFASPNAATYCATKYAVVGLGEALRQEWHGSGVQVSTICPGFVRTELIAGMRPPAGTERLLMIDPEQVAASVVGALARGRSRTVSVPSHLVPSVKVFTLVPERLRDRVFRAVGGHRVTSGLDVEKRAAYQRRLENS